MTTSATFATRRHQRLAFTRKHVKALLIWTGFAILGYVALAAAIRHPTPPLDESAPIAFVGGTAAAAGVAADGDGVLTIPALDWVTKVSSEVPEPRECSAGVTTACVFE